LDAVRAQYLTDAKAKTEAAAAAAAEQARIEQQHALAETQAHVQAQLAAKARADAEQERERALAANEERRRQLESDRVAAEAAAEAGRREAERVQLAKDAVDAAIALRDRGALADAVSIASGMAVTDSAADEWQKSLTVAARVLSYLQLRATKPQHAAWSCAEVRTAFEALASVHSLAADSSAAVVRYFADETVDGALLSVLAADADIIKELVPNSLRRHRLTAVLSEMCADSVGAAKAPVPVPVPVPVAAALAPLPVLVTVAIAGTASPHAASAASCLSNDEEQVVSPVCVCVLCMSIQMMSPVCIMSHALLVKFVFS
jgi:hypothetical protein